jgi:hypothetical protein
MGRDQGTTTSGASDDSDDEEEESQRPTASELSEEAVLLEEEEFIAMDTELNKELSSSGKKRGRCFRYWISFPIFIKVQSFDLL